jgi:hypothetical protein
MSHQSENPDDKLLSIRGLKTSLNTRRRAAEREMQRRPNSAAGQLYLLKVLYAQEMLDAYIESKNEVNK